MRPYLKTQQTSLHSSAHSISASGIKAESTRKLAQAGQGRPENRTGDPQDQGLWSNNTGRVMLTARTIFKKWVRNIDHCLGKLAKHQASAAVLIRIIGGTSSYWLLMAITRTATDSPKSSKGANGSHPGSTALHSITLHTAEGPESHS